MKTMTIKIDTKTIEAAARDCDMTPADYVARSVGFYKGRRVAASKVGTEGGMTLFEIFGSRKHTRRQLDRAGRQLAHMDKAERTRMERLAVKHGTTSTEAVANVNRVLATPNGCGTLPVGLEPMTEECWERLAVKYGMPVERLRCMTADQLTRLFCKRA